MNNLLKLEDTRCPCCGEKSLRLKETGDWWPEFPEYYVGCDNCNWDYYESKSTDCGDALVMFFDYTDIKERNKKMVTKEQERKALKQIKKIVDSLGEDSYIRTAFEGCFEIAEENIENDWACSMKQEVENYKKMLEEANKQLNNASKQIEEQSKIIESNSSRILSDDDLTDFYQLVENSLYETEQEITEEASNIVKFAEDPESDKFQNSVTCHRAYTRRAEYLRSLLNRVNNAMLGIIKE